MGSNAWIAILTTVGMMLLVVLQMEAAGSKRWLTVEQLVADEKYGLSFDRHYAMPIDFCIVAPLVGLVIFLCLSQWTFNTAAVVMGISAAITIGMVCFWWNLPSKEAHNQSFAAAVEHGIFFAVALWAILMVWFETPKPEPVLLLALCIIAPAFLFVGNHMYLGLLNFTGAATSYHDDPIANWIGWAIVVGVAGVGIWRTYVLVPSAFWKSLQ